MYTTTELKNPDGKGENVSVQACLQDRVNEAELSTAALWSTLAAVAMSSEDAVCGTYCDAVRGVATAAYRIRKALREVLACLSEE